MKITDTSRVLKAIADGDLTQRIDLRATLIRFAVTCLSSVAE
jgi:hypothetical protein